MNFREIDFADKEFLRDMLYDALFVPEGKPPFPKSILNEPSIAKYIDNFGIYANDYGIVAEHHNELLGVIWGRTFTLPNTGYGFIDEATPEISMAVKEGYRNLGIGTRLIEKISAYYLSQNIKAISLSVDKMNRAKELYLRSGFEVVAEEGTALTMRKWLFPQ